MRKLCHFEIRDLWPVWNGIGSPICRKLLRCLTHSMSMIDYFFMTYRKQTPMIYSKTEALKDFLAVKKRCLNYRIYKQSKLRRQKHDKNIGSMLPILLQETKSTSRLLRPIFQCIRIWTSANFSVYRKVILWGLWDGFSQKQKETKNLNPFITCQNQWTQNASELSKIFGR